jgi:hypothetical protein
MKQCKLDDGFFARYGFYGSMAATFGDYANAIMGRLQYVPFNFPGAPLVLSTLAPLVMGLIKERLCGHCSQPYDEGKVSYHKYVNLTMLACMILSDATISGLVMKDALELDLSDNYQFTVMLARPVVQLAVSRWLGGVLYRCVNSASALTESDYSELSGDDLDLEGGRVTAANGSGK